MASEKLLGRRDEVLGSGQVAMVDPRTRGGEFGRLLWSSRLLVGDQLIWENG